MRIGGFMPFSLSDYPGIPAAVVFTQGCNFRCPFCHNGALVPDVAGTIPPDKIIASIMKRRQLVSGVVISGGEPCIQKKLPDFCNNLNSRGFKVKLDTNGSFPSVIRKLITNGSIDYIAMDIKAPTEVYSKLSGVNVDISRINESIRILTESGIPHHFRTTNVKPLLSDDDIRQIKGGLPPGAEHVLQVFCPETALDPSLRNKEKQVCQ